MVHCMTPIAIGEIKVSLPSSGTDRTYCKASIESECLHGHLIYWNKRS